MGSQLSMFLGGASDDLARIAFTVSNAKTVALTIGMVLLIAAIVAKVGHAQGPGDTQNRALNFKPESPASSEA